MLNAELLIPRISNNFKASACIYNNFPADCADYKIEPANLICQQKSAKLAGSIVQEIYLSTAISLISSSIL